MAHDLNHLESISEMFQPLIPSVEVSKVTLQLISVPPKSPGARGSGLTHGHGRVPTDHRILVSDPHIDPAGTRRRRNRRTGGTASHPIYKSYEVLTGFVDTDRLSSKERVDVRTGLEERQSNQKLGIKLNLVIKEPIKGKSLLDIALVREALAIKVVLTDTTDSYEAWLRSDEPVRNPVLTPAHPLYGKEELPSLDSVVYTWSAFAAGAEGLNKFEEVEENGQRVSVYPFEINLRMGSISPDNLGVIVYSFLDLDLLWDALTPGGGGASSPGGQWLRGFIGDPGGAVPGGLEGRRDSLMVIRDGQISSTSYVMKDLRGNLWNGSYHWRSSASAGRGTRYAAGGTISLEDLRSETRCLEEAGNKIRLGTFTSREIRCGGVAAVTSVGAVPTPSVPGRVIMRAGPGGKITLDMIKARMKDLAVLIKNAEDMEAVGAATAGWMTGLSVYDLFEYQKPLERNQIEIHKVQDFRVFEQIQNFEIQFSWIENAIFTALKKDLRNNRIDINQSSTYFSDIFLSRDINDGCRFFFSFDWQRMLVENSIFGNLCKSIPGRPTHPGHSAARVGFSILDESEIVSMKLYRTRVEGSGEIGSKPINYSKTIINPPKIKPKVFEENQIDEHIITAEDAWSTTFSYNIDPKTGQRLIHQRIEQFAVPMERQNQPVAITTKAGISEITSNDLAISSLPGAPNNELRHITGMDNTVLEKTDGYYQYKVVFEILDKSIAIIEKKREDLDLWIDGLKRYYEEATKTIRTVDDAVLVGSPYLAPNPIRATGIQGIRRSEIRTLRGELKYGNFNSKTNRFINAFAERYAPVTGGRELVSIVPQRGFPEPLAGVALKDSIMGFAELIIFLSKNPRVSVNSGIAKGLLGYLNPWSATPASINAVIRLMETISSKLGTILGTVNPTEVPVTTPMPNEKRIVQKTHSPAKNKTFKITHEFSSIFNANQQTHLGFDFLGTTIPLSETPGLFDTSLYQMRLSDFATQTQSELTKIWTSTGIAITNLIANPTANPALPAFDGGAVGRTAGVYFTPARVVLPGGSIDPTTNQPMESFDIHHGALGLRAKFLRSVSYSLYGKRTGGQFLGQITSKPGVTIATARRGAGIKEDDLGKLANDLSDYFTVHHDTDVVTPDNIAGQSIYSYVVNNVSTRREADPRLQPGPGSGSLISTQLDEGIGDEYYKTMRNLSQTQRERAYNFYFSMLKQVQFDSKDQGYIPQPEAPLRIEDWSLVQQGQPNSPIQRIFGQSSTARRTGLFKEAPPQIKSLLYYESLINNPISPLQQRTRDLYADLGTDTDLIAEFTLTTQIINKIEFLSGYSRGTLSVPNDPRTTGTNAAKSRVQQLPASQQEPVHLLGLPQWQSTNGVNMGQKKGRKLFCRSMPYEEQSLLIRRSKPFDLPVYDEYFLIEVAS